MTSKTNLFWIKVVSIIALLNLLGCTVETKSNDNSPNKDVAVSTPVGSLKVENTSDVDKIGVKLYPGATPKPDADSDHHNSNANISVATSLFGMKLLVQKYQASDPPEKIIAFYQAELSKFGKVIRCNKGDASSVSHDQDKNHNDKNHNKDAPVSCDADNSHSTDDYQTVLKVGTERNQHIVAVKAQEKGSEFALVYVRVRGDKKESM